MNISEWLRVMSLGALNALKLCIHKEGKKKFNNNNNTTNVTQNNTPSKKAFQRSIAQKQKEVK